MWLVVGLGNPGEKYERTRHNVGFMVVDAIARKLNTSFIKAFRGEVAKANFEQESLVLLKPLTFMNLSGESIQEAKQFHKLTLDQIIVVHDELDVPFGSVRVKVDGGHGGHNGIRDTVRAIGPAFIRVRVGVGRPAIKGTEADFVLNNYRKDEQVVLAEQIVDACDAVFAVMTEGAQKAQMRFNQKQTPLAKKE